MAFLTHCFSFLWNKQLKLDLRQLEDINKAGDDVIEILRTENDQLRNEVSMHQEHQGKLMMLTTVKHEDRVVPFENKRGDTPAKTGGINAKLQQYKSMFSLMEASIKDFNCQLSELMSVSGELSEPSAISPPLTMADNVHSLVPFDGQEVAALPISSELNQAMDVSEDQMHNLELAQKLGDAVAEKEFAVETVAKLGSKMNDLIVRNRELSNLADEKNRGHHSVKTRQTKLTQDPEGRDTDAPNNFASKSVYTKEELDYPPLARYHGDDPTPSRLSDDHSTCSVDSTIMTNERTEQTANNVIVSFDPPEQLEPESAATLLERSGGGDFLRGQPIGRKAINSQRVSNYRFGTPLKEGSGPTLIKVPGGEYFGQLNEHGKIVDCTDVLLSIGAKVAHLAMTSSHGTSLSLS